MAVERWTDEMLDELASSTSDLKQTVNGLTITSQALLQIAAQHQRKSEELEQRQAENDHRFNVLLEEVRFLIRNQNDNQDS